MKVYYLHELKSSRLQYDKNPPNFLFFIIITIFVCLISLILLSCFTYRTEVINASGVFESESKITINSHVSGEIENVNINSGSYVKKGDILFNIKDDQIDNQILIYQGKYNLLDDYIKNVKSIIDFLNNIDFSKKIENPFNDGMFYIEVDGIIKELNGLKTVEEKQEMSKKMAAQYEGNLFQYNMQFIELKSQLEALNKMKDNYNIYATEDGYVTYVNELKKGMFVDNNVIGSISQELNENNSIIETYIDSSHINFIEKGTDVTISIKGLPSSKYGVIHGSIQYISKDSMISEKGVFYKITIKPDTNILPFDDTEIINGMVADIKIKYENITWMKWFLKKIGFVN